MRGFGGCLSIGLVIAFAAAPAWADAPTVDWHGFAAIGVTADQLPVLDAAVTTGLPQGGLAGDVVDGRAGGASCGSSISCHCGLARDKGVRYAAFGTVGNLGALWTVELTLIDTHACTVESTEYFNEGMRYETAAVRILKLARQITTPRNAVAQTASKRPEEVALTPAIVSSITKRQMRELQLRSLDQVLPLFPGIEIADANWGEVVLDQNLQNTLLLMVDGIPLVNGLTNFRTIGRDYRTSLHHLDRIELVRGPGGVLWGQDAFLGVVNFISEAPSRREASVDAGLTTTSFDTQEMYVQGVQNRGDYGFNVAVESGRRGGATTYVRNSPYAVLGLPPGEPRPYGNAGTTDNEADTWLDVFLRLQLTKYVTLFAQNHSNKTNWEISPFGVLLDGGAGGYWKKDHRVYAAVGTLPAGDFTWRAQLSRYEQLSWENFAVQPAVPNADPSEPDAVRNGLRSLQGSRDPRVANQAELSLTHQYRDAIENYVVAGIGVLHLLTPKNVATLVGIREDPVKESPDIGQKNFVTISQYVLDEARLASWLVLSAGARLYADRPYVPSEPWKAHGTAQAGFAVGNELYGAKLVYAEGYRPPNAVSLFSAVGTKGNPTLDPEHSRELALELRGEVTPELTLTVGGSVTRLRDLIVLQPLENDPDNFAYTPVNRGVTELASGFVQVKTSVGPWVDAWLTYHMSGLRESEPQGTGIPAATHSGSFAAIWRPLEDISAFVRGSFSSPRTVQLATQAGPVDVTTPVTIRTTVGMTLSELVGGVDLDLAVDNPINRTHDVPYRLDGTTSNLIEHRRGVEFMATARIDR